MLAFARRRPVKLAIDVAVLVFFLALFITREGSGDSYTLHSWVGIIAVPLVALHLLGNWGWVTRLLKRGRQDRQFRLGVLNGAFFAMAAAATITGFPAWAGVESFNTPHAITGFLSILLMLVHIGANIGPLRQLLARRSAPAMSTS